MRNFLAVVSAAALLLLSGCAGMLGETGLRNATEADLKPLHANKTIYYKVVLHDFNMWGKPMDLSRPIYNWSHIGDHMNYIGEPMKSPDKYALQFRDGYIKAVKEMLAEKGYSLVEADGANQSGIYVEMRIAPWRGIRLLRRTIMATEWDITYPATAKPLVIYQWDTGRFLSTLTQLSLDPPEEEAAALAKKVVETFLSGTP